jgi:quinol-cytochrome oxidoreductase complex cytochrome b subunit
MSIWGKIFGTDKHVEQGLGIIERAGDALFYTDEEKTTDRNNKAQQIRQFITDWMETTKGQNIARRTLAVGITAVWLSMYLISTIIGVVAPWVDSTIPINELGQIIEGSMSTYEKLTASELSLDRKADRMSGAVMLILAFYFAAPYMGKVVVGAMEKFGGKKS